MFITGKNGDAGDNGGVGGATTVGCLQYGFTGNISDEEEEE